MLKRTKEGACLRVLVEMAISICQRAEQECPRTGPGRRPEIPDWMMAVLIMVVVAKRRKAKSAQFRYLKAHQEQLARLLKTRRFPSRSTYFDRYKRAYMLFQQALRIQSLQEAEIGHINLECVAVDKSLIETCGRKWSRREKVKNRFPPGADADSAWTYSPYHGWLLGYGYEVVVTAEKRGVVWPVLGSLEPANVSEKRTFASKVEQLPPQTRYVLADKGYDSEDLAVVVEARPYSHRRQRRFVCPLQERHNVGRAKKTWRETHRRRLRKERRNVRRTYMKTPRARKLFSRRSRTVEPFNEWFKSLFELDQKSWHRGLDNNRTQVMAAMFVYQLLLRHNRNNNQSNGRIRWFLDIL